MLATLVIEREPLQWSDMPGALVSWVQDVGGFAMVGLVIWFLVRRWQRTGTASEGAKPVRDRLFKLLIGVASLAYIAGGGLKLYANLQPPLAATGAAAAPTLSQADRLASNSFAIGGACAILAILVPFFADL